MSVFDLASDTLFSDANMATDVVFTPVAGASVTVRAIRRAPDVVRDFMDSRLHSATAVFEIRLSDVAAIGRGDTITDGAEVFTVLGDPVRDGHRLKWVVETE